MFWIGLILVSPIWGILSTALFMQIWLAILNIFINFFGFVKGTVARTSTGLALVISLVAAVSFSVLLQAGYWLLNDVLHFGATKTENVVYWLFAGITLIGIIIEIPGKLRKNWRQATVLGALEADIYSKQFKNAQRLEGSSAHGGRTEVQIPS